MSKIKGTKDSEETRQKKREASLRTWASGTRFAQSGWTLTDETKEKMAAAKRGVPKSPEHRAALSAAKRAYDARRAAGEV